jgi:hypothetical protein
MTEVENVEVEEVERVETVDVIRTAENGGKRDSGVSVRIDAEPSEFVVKIAGRKRRRAIRYLMLVISPAP